MATPGPRVRPGHPVAARARGRLRLRRDPRPAGQHRRGQGRHGAPVPMDRLICGDVGYGKTEIAVRAAFKAVQDGKQVAVLVPTTLLVQQHLQTFTERYAQFPVVVKALSPVPDRHRGQGGHRRAARTARSTSSSAPTGCSSGEVALQGPRAGRRRRGAALRRRAQGAAQGACARPSTCWPCRATPIPRTLEMAVTGIREMSTLATPPEERHPVLTFVGAYDEKQITAAIRRELLREGQVFYVHNKVSSIEKAAARMRELVPGGADRDRARADGRAQARAGRRWTSGRRGSTCWSARRSSRPAWTSPTPTR